MTLLDGWKALPLVVKILIILVLVSFLFQLLGFAVPLWLSISGSIPIEFKTMDGITMGVANLDHLGIWQACGSDHGCVAITFNIPGYMIATRLFITLGFIGSFLILICTALLVMTKLGENGKFMVITAISALITAICTAIGLIVWGSEFSNAAKYLSFSFACCCISCILYGIISLLMVIIIRSK